MSVARVPGEPVTLLDVPAGLLAVPHSEGVIDTDLVLPRMITLADVFNDH